MRIVQGAGAVGTFPFAAIFIRFRGREQVYSGLSPVVRSFFAGFHCGVRRSKRAAIAVHGQGRRCPTGCNLIPDRRGIRLHLFHK
jgi:hypothetical protein